MQKPTVLIVGYGVVGKNTHKVFPWADVYDRYVPGANTVQDDCLYDFAFICVPTPSREDGGCDIREVHRAAAATKARILIIKSTVPPGTTERLVAWTGKDLVFSPEYYGETQHANHPEYNFVILGGLQSETKAVAQLYQHVYTGHLKIYQTDFRTAELAKYMENSFLATKVIFCNEFYRIAQRLGINYSVLRELFILDPRVGPSHTFVYEDQPYYDSKCLNKDLPALVQNCRAAEAGLIRYVIQRNEEFKNDL